MLVHKINLHSLFVGEGVTVGAGSVVAGRIPAGITVMGNPARRFSYK